MASNYQPEDHSLYIVYKTQHPPLTTIIPCSVKFCYCGALKYIF